MDIVVVIFGFIWMVKGEIKVSKKRRISAQLGRSLGALMFFGSLLLMFVPMPENSSLICLGILVIFPFIVGLAFAEKVEVSSGRPATDQKNS